MSCKTETEQIGDHEVSVTQWPATRAMSVKIRLVKMFGASIALIASNFSNDSKKKDTSSNDAKALSDGLSTLFQNNSPDEVVGLIKECVIGVAYDEKKITSSSFDELFSGDDLMEVYKVFMFVLKVNYSNLMNGQLAERLLAKAKENL